MRAEREASQADKLSVGPSEQLVNSPPDHLTVTTRVAQIYRHHLVGKRSDPDQSLTGREKEVAVLVSQGQPILPLFIRSALNSEVMLGRQNLAFALAFEMVVVVAVVMTLYSLLVRRTSRWLQ